MAYTVNKYYRNIKGLDLRVSDLLRDQDAATEAINVMYRQTGAISKRNGYQIKLDNNVGGAGLIKYNNVEIGTGTITEELLALDDNLNKLTERTFTITYAGSGDAYYDFYLDPTTQDFYFDLYEDNVRVLNQSLGTGKGASDTTVVQLDTAVDAVTDFSMTYTGTGATPAAFAELGRIVTVSSSGTDVTYYEWSTVDTPGTYSDPFTNHWGTRNNADFENASSAQLQEALYIANGYDVLHKYDGNRVYKAGLPQPGTLSDSSGAGGSLSAGDYQWKVVYEHTDAKENVVTSADSEILTVTATGSDSVDITIPNIQASTGYGMAQGQVNGAQASVNTITLDSGHEFKINDQVYIDDGVSGEVVKRKVTATTTTSITVNGDAVTVADNDYISQCKIILYRTKVDGTLFYLSKELINDSSSASQDYDDGLADSSLLIEKTEPIKLRSLPPTCRYIDTWRNQIVLTGDKDDVNTVYYSDFEIESFPLDQSFITEARLGGGNSGIKSLDNTLFIFKPRSIITVTGDLGTDNFQVDALGDDGIGCVAHATIQEVEGNLWFLAKRGIYSVNRSGYTKQSDRVEPRFENSNYKEKRATAFYWIEKDIYMVQLPFFLEDGSSNMYIDENNSFIMVYDLYREAWLQWNKMNIASGVATLNGSLYFSNIDEDPVSLNANAYLYKVLDSGLEEDYADHENAITLTYKTHWEALGNPSIYKKFLRMKLHALDGTINDFETDKFTVTITTEHDYVPSTESSFSLDFSGGSLGWGESPWGEFIWGESRLEQLRSKLKSKKAKALRSVFTNSTIHENILISGWEYEIASSYDVQIKE
jgi:hypothetical protein